MTASRDIVDCPLHGDQGPAYVCQHLDLRNPIGFVEAYDPDDPETEPFHAWCSACDRVLVAEGEWNDASEAAAKPRLVCRACYRAMKALNRGMPDGDPVVQ